MTQGLRDFRFFIGSILHEFFFNLNKKDISHYTSVPNLVSVTKIRNWTC